MAIYHGSCHCGAIGFEYSTAVRPSEWDVRACQCSFCMAHGAACTTDPSGYVAFNLTEESELQRYRFGLRTADFLVCRNCGVYIGAVLDGAEGGFATVNTRSIASVQGSIPAPRPVEFDGEPANVRRTRRQAQWTPVVRRAW